MTDPAASPAGPPPRRDELTDQHGSHDLDERGVGSGQALTVAEVAARHPRGSGAGAGEDGRGNKWLTLVAVCLGTFMLLLDVTIVNVALPDIQTTLHASFSDLQWIVDAYALSLAALLLTSGSLADLYGRRRLYVIGLAIFTLASLVCGLAQTTLMLELSRVVQGVGGAIMFSVSLALLADAFRGSDRGVAFGVWGAVTGLAVAIGPLLGGVLTSGLSWRWIFFVNLPIGVGATVLVVMKVRESRAPHARRPDWPGFVLFTVALASLVYGLIESNERSFSDGRVIAALVGAGVLLVAFTVVESRRSSPMLDLTLFRKPTFTGGSVAAFGLSASLFSLLLYLVLYLQDVLGFSALQTGLRLLLISVGILTTSTVAGRLTSHIPVRFLIGPGLALVGVGLLLMRGLTASSEWTHLVPGMLVAGAGAGLVNPPLASTAIGVVRPENAGMASGINSTFRQVGIATGIALLGTLFTSRVTETIMAGVHKIPQVSGQQLATAVKSGASQRASAAVPPDVRGQVTLLTRQAFVAGLDRIFLVGALIAFGSAVIAFAAIRSKDFAAQGHE